MICFFTRTYSLSRGVSGNCTGEYVGTGLIRLFRMFADMSSSMRCLLSSAVLNTGATTTGGIGAAGVAEAFTSFLASFFASLLAAVLATLTTLSIGREA